MLKKSAREMTRDRVLGVDPSFNRTGWASFSSDAELLGAGVIKPSGQEQSERLLSIQRQFSTALATTRPGLVMFERPGSWRRRGGTRRETIEVMGMARGVMLSACAGCGVLVVDVPFHTVRRELLGRPNAGRDEILNYLQKQGFEVPRRPRGGPDLDVANACMMALYGLSLVNPL